MGLAHFGWGTFCRLPYVHTINVLIDKKALRPETWIRVSENIILDEFIED